MKDESDRPSSRDLPANARQILHARAQVLSRPPAPVPAPGTRLELLEFRLAAERYAVEVRFVQEVHNLKELTPLPCTPAFLPGIVNLRGRLLPVLDLLRFFGLADEGLADLHCILFVHGHDLDLGLLADTVLGIRLLPGDLLQPALTLHAGLRAEYLQGVTSDGLVVLDLDRILGDPRMIVDEAVET
ncbi:MAG: chemotaxis protein CheW [Holophaga sp.]|jgi:purine-binding chemotaxis protein CheW